MIDVSPDLLSFLIEEEERSRNIDLLDRAETALKSYNGAYYGDEVDGCSKVVSRDVAEVVDHMGVSVLRTFVSGDRVVEFEPDGSDMEQAADDATEVMHRDFQRKGYTLLHDWLKEGNISTLGIVKACVETKRQRTEMISIDPEGDGAIEADHIATHPESGIDIYRAVALQDSPPEFKDYLIPLEEFRISPDARDADEAVYIAHACWKTLSELVEMGFEGVDTLQDVGNFGDTLAQVRDGNRSLLTDTRTGATRRVVLMEEYVRFDADGDGIAERLCVHRVGNTILRIEPTDYQPFVVYCPFPMPARIAGHSLADKVTDIQRINTALMRIYLDTQYLSIAPRMWVPDDCVTENTYDDLLTVIAGQVIRGKGPNKPEPLSFQNDGAAALQAIEFMIAQREGRTGITRHNQGLDSDTLNHTATGMALQQAAGQNIEEYLARNFAEAVAKLMRLKLKLYSRYGQPMRLRVDGEFRDIDPSQWPEDMQVMIRVGLGSGRKEQRIQNRMMAFQVIREGMMGGLPIFTSEHVYKMFAGLLKDMSLGSPQDFVDDPSSPEYKQRMANMPPQPDPESQKIQADAMIQAHKVEGDQQMQAAKLEMAREEASQKIQLEAAKAAFEQQQAVAQMEFERQLKMMEFEHEKQLAYYKADRDTEVKKYREGGSQAE